MIYTRQSYIIIIIMQGQPYKEIQLTRTQVAFTYLYNNTIF